MAQQYSGLADEAQQTFDMAGSIEPNTTMLFAEVARLHLKAAAAQQAKQHLKGQALSFDNDHLLRIQADRFAQVVDEHPDRADQRYRFGLLLRALGKSAQAADEFTAAVEINPDYTQAWIKLGLAQKQLDRQEQAIDAFTRAVILEPGYADAHYQLGLLYADRSR